MKYVQPIRDKNKIEEIKTYLKENGTRDLLLFTMGINTGLRISDLLNLKILDVKGKSHVEIKEQKTGKIKRFPSKSRHCFSLCNCCYMGTAIIQFLIQNGSKSKRKYPCVFRH